MSDKEAIKKAILDAAGNPSVGAIAEMADQMAEAVVNLGNPNRAVKYSAELSDKKETRVVHAYETR
jgi:hypothetical protein